MKTNFKATNTMVTMGYTILGLVDSTILNLGLIVIGFVTINLIMFIASLIILE